METNSAVLQAIASLGNHLGNQHEGALVQHESVHPSHTLQVSECVVLGEHRLALAWSLADVTNMKEPWSNMSLDDAFIGFLLHKSTWAIAAIFLHFGGL